jgi:hypothetical protein
MFDVTKQLDEARDEAQMRQRELQQAKVDIAVLRAQLDQAKGESQKSTSRPRD